MFPGGYFAKTMFTGSYFAPVSSESGGGGGSDNTSSNSPLFIVNVGRFMNR